MSAENDDKPLRFCDLPDGASFKFFPGGSLLTKTGARSYEAPQWGQYGNIAHDIEQAVIHVERDRGGS